MINTLEEALARYRGALKAHMGRVQEIRSHYGDDWRGKFWSAHHGYHGQGSPILEEEELKGMEKVLGLSEEEVVRFKAEEGV